jgi:hypothetical protein
MRYALLVIRALLELLRYDVIHAVRGFHYLCRKLEEQPLPPAEGASKLEHQVCQAVSLAACFYWKRVYCLQRSVAAARVLRSSGIPARVVIGYRPSPFFSHAWVEVNGTVVNDSPVYRERMQILCTF